MFYFQINTRKTNKSVISFLLQYYYYYITILVCSYSHSSFSLILILLLTITVTAMLLLCYQLQLTCHTIADVVVVVVVGGGVITVTQVQVHIAQCYFYHCEQTASHVRALFPIMNQKKKNMNVIVLLPPLPSSLPTTKSNAH